MSHIPILRAGRPYKSLNRTALRDIRTGEVVAQVSQANRGLIAKDLARAGDNQAAFGELGADELMAICGKAAELFVSGDLPLGEDESQTGDEYVAQLSSTTGLPVALCRGNMEKTRRVLVEMRTVLGGLTRDLDLGILQSGWGEHNGRTLSFQRQVDVLGAVLPNNSPGVHTLWLPSIPLRVPVALKPGGQEPWTAYRIAQAFMAAGCPPEAFGFYPADYAAATEILLRCGRSLLFGGDATVAPWKVDPRVEVHGTGRSKIIFGADTAAAWPDHLGFLLQSIAGNSGRSCINASGVWTPQGGGEMAEGLAQQLLSLQPGSLSDPQSELAAFANADMARSISDSIDTLLKTPGAEDVSARLGRGERVVELDGCTFLQPTVIHCTDADHPLANVEYLFPFVSVVDADDDAVIERVTPSLVVSALTNDPSLRHRLLQCPGIDRLNFGPVPTNQVSFDQPHEGNLFEHLYRQRSFAIHS